MQRGHVLGDQSVIQVSPAPMRQAALIVGIVRINKGQKEKAPNFRKPCNQVESVQIHLDGGGSGTIGDTAGGAGVSTVVDAVAMLLTDTILVWDIIVIVDVKTKLGSGDVAVTPK